MGAQGTALQARKSKPQDALAILDERFEGVSSWRNRSRGSMPLALAITVGRMVSTGDSPVGCLSKKEVDTPFPCFVVKKEGGSDTPSPLAQGK
jgi:hypothetical protein